MSDDPKNGQNGQNGQSGAAQSPKVIEVGKGSAFYMQQLINTERPARMVGLFTMRQMKPHEVERLVGVCLQAMREEDQGASLTLKPLGDPAPQDLELQRTWRVTVAEYTDAQPHDCLVQLFDMDDPGSTHRALLDHLFNMDEALGQDGVTATQGRRPI